MNSFFGRTATCRALGPDLVVSINAAVEVLRGRPAPAPYSIKDRKEALLMVAHFVGDLHQPLHVGAIYLDDAGKVIDPDRRPGEDAHAIEENFATRGGNSIRIFGADLHTLWDHVPPAWGSQATDSFVASAKAVHATPGAAEALAATWATETVRLSPEAFDGLEFGPKVAGKWVATASEPAAYKATVVAIQGQQIAKAGARLAELLKRIWPND
jgi:hypothetical protein